MLALLVASLAVATAVAVAEDETQLWRRAINNDDAQALVQLFDSSRLSVTNEKGKNALMSAAKLGDFRLYDRLLEGGLNPLERSNTGGTVLMYAVLGNRLEFVDFVLAQQPDVDLQSTNGWTALMIAAAKGFGDVLNALIAAGADINLADGYRWSPLMRAIDNRHSVAIEILARHPDARLDWQNENKATALHVAASAGDLESVRLLLSLNADAELLNNNGQRALDVARAADHPEIVELLAD